MATRFLFSTSTHIGGQTVQLRHKGLWLGDKDKTKITGMIQRAKTMLSTTIAAISSGPNAICRTHANTYFLCTPTPDEWRSVMAKLELTYGGLNSNFSLKLGADGDFGFVTSSVVSSTTPGAVIDRDGDHILRNGTIHVSKKRMLKSAELGIITIIHEATHKYANAWDHGDAGYREKDDSGWWEPGLQKDQALNNADSLAYFCYRVGESSGV